MPDAWLPAPIRALCCFYPGTRPGRQTRYIADRKGRVLREALHRPSEAAGGRPLVISTHTMGQGGAQGQGGGELVRRAKQYVSVPLPAGPHARRPAPRPLHAHCTSGLQQAS